VRDDHGRIARDKSFEAAVEPGDLVADYILKDFAAAR
jgi:hypothetical protein